MIVDGSTKKCQQGSRKGEYVVKFKSTDFQKALAMACGIYNIHGSKIT